MVHESMVLAEIAGGTLLALTVLFDAFETIILSRRVSRRTRLTTIFYRLTWPAWRKAARRFRLGNQRENFLTVYGPLSLLALIVCWALGLLLAFGLLHDGFGSKLVTADGHGGFAAALYMSGTTLFTLGIGDVVPHSMIGRILTVLESGIGLGFLALVVAYLPVLSQAFSGREVNISLLDARAGSPPTASELLRRHCRGHSGDALGELLREWERWSAELLESHVSFPVLAFYRSQHDNQSWVAALTAVLDTCSLVITTIEDGPTPQARLTFAMARHAIVDMCRVLNQQALAMEHDRLPPEDLARLRAALEAGGIALRREAEPEQTLAEMRGMYEPYVHALGRFLLMPLPSWVPPGPVRDNWVATV